MGFLKPKMPPPPPPPAPPPPMPDPQSASVREAQRRAANEILSRAGRSSTILSGDNDRQSGKLGGGRS